MAVGDLITEDWEMEYEGVLFGGDTPFSIASVEGLADLPSLVTSDRDRLRRHGTVAGDDFLSGREVIVSVEVRGDTPEEFTSAINDLRRITTPGEDEQPLAFQLPGLGDGGKCVVFARPRKRDLPVASEFFYRIPVANIAFYCTDPRLYSLEQTVANGILPQSSGEGWQFPETPNITFGTLAVGGNLLLENTGTFRTPVQLRIDGPVTNPRVQNLATGQTIGLDITLSTGEFILIDTEARTILLNGMASRYFALTETSEWWDLAPGTSEVTYRANTSTESTLTVTYRNAWV